MINKDRVYKIIYVILFILVAILIYNSRSFTEKVYDFSKSYNFSKSWKMSIEGTNIKEQVNLPYNTSKNRIENTISIENTVPKKDVKSPHIRVGSSQQSFKVYVEGNLIYNFDSMRAINHGKTGGAVWKIIELPSDSLGKNIKIEFKSSYLKTCGSIAKIKFGTKDQLIADLFLETVFDNLISIALLILAIFVMYINIKTKNEGIESNYIYLILMILCIFTWISSESQFYVFVYNNYVFNYYVQFIALFLFPIFLYKYLLLEYKLKPKNIIEIFYNIHIYLMIVLIVGQVVGYITFFQGQWLFLIIFSITFFTSIIFILFQASYDLKLRGLLRLLVLIFICLILDYVLYDIKGNVIKFSFINISIIIIELFVARNIYKEFFKLAEEKEKSRNLELQLNYQLKHYSYLEENNLNLKRYRHDMANHWILLNRLIKNKELHSAEEYSSKMAKQIVEEENLIIDTSNPILDAILTEKIHKANSYNIDVSTEIIISNNLKIDSIDSCTIFGNILDNAIEACLKFDKRRYIEIKLNSINNMLICKFKNSINPNELIMKDLKTTKEDKDKHGFGMINIQKAIEKYNGYIDISHNNEYFEIAIVLYDV